MIARVVPLAAAVAGVVLLAGDLRVARDIERAVALSAGERTAADAERAVQLLRGAAARTSDTTPLLREAQLELFLRRPARALAPARAAAGREPENAQAWLLVAQAAAGSGDPALEARARRRIAALVARP